MLGSTFFTAIRPASLRLAAQQHSRPSDQPGMPWSFQICSVYKRRGIFCLHPHSAAWPLTSFVYDAACRGTCRTPVATIPHAAHALMGHTLHAARCGTRRTPKAACAPETCFTLRVSLVLTFVGFSVSEMSDICRLISNISNFY